jgi:hypothetical protein
MPGRGRASRAASAVTATAYMFAAASILVVAAVCIVGARPVQALPSYARQTGQQCADCHFPNSRPMAASSSSTATFGPAARRTSRRSPRW